MAVVEQALPNAMVLAGFARICVWPLNSNHVFPSQGKDRTDTPRHELGTLVATQTYIA